MVASAHDDGDARSAMADCMSSLAARGGGEEMRTGAGECVGQARGVLKTRPAVPGCPWRVACTRRRPATGGAIRPANSELVGHDVTERFLKKKRDSVILLSLTEQLRCDKTANSLIHYKNSVHENCRSTIRLQFLFKDHHLIRHGSAVTSSQSWFDPLKM